MAPSVPFTTARKPSTKPVQLQTIAPELLTQVRLTQKPYDFDYAIRL